jgi:hypothetical protein
MIGFLKAHIQCNFIVGDVDKPYHLTLIPKHKMATPFCVFKTLTGFDFQFTKV